MDERTLVSGNGGEESQFPPLARQPSDYNLSLDHNEVQSNMGNISDPLNTSMAHLDELLKNVISVDPEGSLLQNHSSSSSLPTSFFLGNFDVNGAFFNSKKKSVDEVWKEISHHDHHELNLNSTAANESLHHQSLTSIGEPSEAATTPEHLLVRAGIINAHPMMPNDPTVVVSEQPDWFQFHVAAAAQQQMTMLDSNFKVCESVFESSSLAMNLDSYSDQNNQVGGMSMPMPEISATSSSESQAAHAERKRNHSDEMKEKSIERRQKRMIKNRESAARSRARKQAYTNQLEIDVFHLRKMNSWLKKQKEVEILLSSNSTNSRPKYQLRRISSTPF